MNKKEVLSLVDAIMHEFASSYRNEAKNRVEEKFKANNEWDSIALYQVRDVLQGNFSTDMVNKIMPQMEERAL